MAFPATTPSLLLLILPLLHLSLSLESPPNPYLSESTLFRDYQKMTTTFKIFTYPPVSTTPDNTITNTTLSFFHTSLLSSPFITSDPEQAHLFFLPFPPRESSPRSLSRLISTLRPSYPYWDRALGADHFYMSCDGIGASSDRNVVELKKNAVQISCFPVATDSGNFVPHKDITFPPIGMMLRGGPLRLPRSSPEERGFQYIAYCRHRPSTAGSDFINQLKGDPEYMIESQPPDEATYASRLRGSRFCIFIYDREALLGLGDALAYGCVPVIISDRPIQDLPFMDLLKWQEMAIFVGTQVGVRGLKHVLAQKMTGNEYEKMRGCGAAVAHHFVWNLPPVPYDGFHMLMYQLWLRRHAIRYTRWNSA